MVEILTPLSLWVQMASLCFTVSGVLADLLVIRLFLFFAYIFLFLNSVLGSPRWPDLYNANALHLDGLIWSSIGLYVHGYSLVRLLLDERQVTFASTEEAALSRMFYRTSGLSERLFQVIISPHLEIVNVEAGQDIPVQDHFYIVYTGNVMMHVYDEKEFVFKRIIRSSEAFDFNDLHLFTTASGETIFDKHSITCTSLTTTRLFRFGRDEMKKVAQHQPFSKGVWQALLINNLSLVVESYATTVAANTTTDSYQQRHQQHLHRIVTDDALLAPDKIFEPLQDYERPHPLEAGSGLAVQSPLRALRHIVRSLTSSFAPPCWPCADGGHFTGIRQTLLAMPPRQQDSTTRRWRHNKSSMMDSSISAISAKIAMEEEAIRHEDGNTHSR
jgi:CRP-like cAMP-binding protein